VVKKGKTVKTNMILRVNQDLCTGCGCCAEICPRQAISLSSGLVWIDQNRCHHCGLCLDVCPQGAITELIPVSQRDLHENVAGLKSRTDNLISRIDKLKEQ
jgi:Fe-S-cluster-containing hydrogenase component 2